MLSKAMDHVTANDYATGSKPTRKVPGCVKLRWLTPKSKRNEEWKYTNVDEIAKADAKAELMVQSPGEGVSIWVVESEHIIASNPSESEALYDPANDKVYRHPTFYNLPDELEHM